MRYIFLDVQKRVPTLVLRPPTVQPRRVFGLLSDDRGQGLVEYALVIALVSIVAIVALRLLGKKANNTLNNAAGALS